MEKITALSLLVLLISVTSVAAPWAYDLVTNRLRLPTALLATATRPTDIFSWADQVVQEPPRSTRRERRPKKEKMPTKTANTPIEPLEVQGYNDTEYPDPTAEVSIGDVVRTGEQPLFEQDPSQVLNVTVNVSYARYEGGTHAIRVLDGTGQVLLQLTAAQSHQLAVDLHDGADIVGDVRQKAGYSS